MKLKAKNLKRKTATILSFTLLLYTLTFTLFTSPTYAATPCSAAGGGIAIGDCFGFGKITSLGQGTSKLVPTIFSLAASLVIIYFLWGSYKYITSLGNKEEVQNARNMITHAIIGFIILIFVFFILPFIMFKLFGITDYSPI